MFKRLRQRFHDWSTRGEQAVDRAFSGRLVLSDEEFYQRFFAGSGIAPEVVAKVRQAYVELLPLDMHRLHPDDDFSRELQVVWDFDSMADVELVCELEKRFGISFPRDGVLEIVTMRQMVEFVDRAVKAKKHP